MNLRPPGYEPDELPTALLRDIELGPVGAGDRTRTGTVLLPGDFKSPVSTIPPHRRISARSIIPHPSLPVNPLFLKFLVMAGTGTFSGRDTYIGLCSNGWRFFYGSEGNDGAAEAGPGGSAGGDGVPGRPDAAGAAVRQRRGPHPAAGRPPGGGRGRLRHQRDASGHHEHAPWCSGSAKACKNREEGRQCRSWRKN